MRLLRGTEINSLSLMKGHWFFLTVLGPPNTYLIACALPAADIKAQHLQYILHIMT